MDVPVSKYKLEQEGFVLFMKVHRPLRVTFQFTCLKCDNVLAVSVDRSNRDDRFKVSDTIPQNSVSATPVIAVMGDFTIKEKMVDSEVEWIGDFHDNVVPFSTIDGGNVLIPAVEQRYDMLVQNKLEQIRAEYGGPVDLETDSASKTTSEEDEANFGNDDDGEDKNFWSDMRFNYLQEHKDEMRMEKKEAREEKRKLMREKQRK